MTDEAPEDLPIPNFFDPEHLGDVSMEEMMQSFELLNVLSQALFPDGLPDPEHVTWRDQKKGAAVDAPHDARERALAKLEAAERRFKNLVEQIPAVTFMAVLGEGENEVYVSPHIEQMLGYSQEEWLADPFLWYWRLHPDDRELWNQEFARGTRTGGPFKAECRFMARDGHTVWVHGEARVIRDEKGRPQYLQGIAFDITESKRAERLVLEHAVEDARNEEEQQIAKRVQMALLPDRFDVRGLEIHAHMEPADEVGGDFYEVHPTKDGAWIAIGDVSGHGLDAGLVMMMAQSCLSGLVRARPLGVPGEVLALLNASLHDAIEARLRSEHYITLCLLRYRADGRVTYAGAHEHIFVKRTSGEVEVIETPGVWVGLRAEILRMSPNHELRLSPGDVLVLFTDGVIEIPDADGEQWDMHRLREAIAEGPVDPKGLVDHVLTKMRGHAASQPDDVTLLVARYRGE